MLRAAAQRVSVVLAVGTLCLTGGATPQLTSASQSAQQQISQEPPPPQPPPPSIHISRPPIRFVIPHRSYVCEGEIKVFVLVETKAVRLTLNEMVYSLKQVDSASGAKYSNGSIMWWDKGEEASLEDDTDADHPKVLARGCRLVGGTQPSTEAKRQVTGTISFRQRRELPAGARLTVTLQDVTHPYGPTEVVAETETKIGDAQPPIPFAIRFDPLKIDAKHTYAVEAKVRVNGQLLLANETFCPVLTQGYSAKQDVMLKWVAPIP